MKWILPVIILVLFLQLIFSPFFIVNETEQVLILQLGQPVRTIQKAGLYFKLPAPIQTSLFFEKRVLEYDAEPAEIITLDKKNMIIDNFCRWKIINPLKFYESVKNLYGAQARLDDIVYSELRVSLGQHELAEIIADKREFIMNEVTEHCKVKALEYGIEIVNVLIKRADLPPENEKSIFQRMQAERKRKANMYRSEGAEEAMKIRAQTDKEKTIILAEAMEKSEQIKGEGDGEATKIYAESYGKDPSFYQFYKTLEAYKTSFDTSTTVVLPLESEFLKYMSGSQ